MDKIEFLKETVEQMKKLLRELEQDNAPIDAIEIVKESVRTNKILLKDCMAKEIENRVVPFAEAQVDEGALGLTVGRIFKNYKELCRFMGWKVYSGGKAKRLQLEQLERLCKYHKEGNKIVIDEVYSVAIKKPEDGRSKNNIFINPIEVILLFSLRSIDNEKDDLYFSNTKFYKILGLFNKNYDELECLDTSSIVEVLQVDYLTIKSFKVNSKSEANKIINRALKSLYSRKVIDYYEGRIIVDENGVSRLATPEETKIITRVEKETLSSLGCINYGQLEYRSLYGKYTKLVNKKIQESTIKNYKYSYRGYCVTSHNKSVAEEIDRQCKDDNFKLLNDLFAEKMQRVTKSRNRSAIKKEYDSMVFGEPMLLGEASEVFISDSNKLINSYIKH